MLHLVTRLRLVGLLCAVVAFSVTAAPAPVYKPRPTKLWFDGWNKPIAGAGNGHFARDSKTLTITVPDINPGDPALLLREVEGDFVLEVRVNGRFHTANAFGERKAGIVVQFGGTRVRMDRVTENKFGTVSGGFSSEWRGTGRDGGQGNAYVFQDASNIAYFRATRKGNKLILEAKEDKGEWATRNDNCPALTLPKKIEVGVSAEATAAGPFAVEFDQFRLTKQGE